MAFKESRQMLICYYDIVKSVRQRKALREKSPRAFVVGKKWSTCLTEAICHASIRVVLS